MPLRQRHHHLFDLIALLRWIDTLTEGAHDPSLALIGERVRAKLAEFDVRVCVECGTPYLRIPRARHHRCSNCRWKRYLVTANNRARRAPECDKAPHSPAHSQ